MYKDIAVKLEKISKSYRIYPSLLQFMYEAFGIYDLFPSRKKKFNEFQALKNIDVEIKKGERVGIIGRNGAGKSTILKLITGNFKPTTGKIMVNGSVQALMQTGLGFHPELTGRKNVSASLLYNNLLPSELDAAIEEVIDFCELGEFIDYPVKTYSLGMLSRLQFACATAVKPDIMIVDEVLGAGDSYFSGKCSYRMEKLTNSGCTLLLVSHSSDQILQFCDKVIWIEEGEVVKCGNALTVVKLYEEYINKLSKAADNKVTICNETSKSQKKILLRSMLGTVKKAENVISRWAGSEGLKIKSIQVLNEKEKIAETLKQNIPFSIKFDFYAEKPGYYQFKAVVVLFANDGRLITRYISKQLEVNLKAGQTSCVKLLFDSMILGKGEYIFSVALYKSLDAQKLSESEPYDLLSRSFKFKVSSVDQFDPTLVHVPARWSDITSLDVISSDVIPFEEVKNASLS